MRKRTQVEVALRVPLNSNWRLGLKLFPIRGIHTRLRVAWAAIQRPLEAFANEGLIQVIRSILNGGETNFWCSTARSAIASE
jgi:hypothetical protein